MVNSVRYGRVPKRSRELNGPTPSSTEDPNAAVNSCDLRRVSTSGTASTSQASQMCSVASSPSELSGCNASSSNNNSNSSGLGGPTGSGAVGNLNAQQLQAAHHDNNHVNEVVVANNADMTVYEVILCVSQAHRLNCTYTEEQTRDLVRQPNGSLGTDEEGIELQRIWLWQQYATRVTPNIQRLVEFAKRLPGFSDFAQDDQLILIKLGFFETWLTYLARMINETSITFDDGTFVTRHHLGIIYDAEFVVSLFNFASAFNGYGLSDTEIGLFSAMVLLAPDRPGVTEPRRVARARERISEALRVQLVRTRNGSPQVLQLMPALEARIPELRSLGIQHIEHCNWLRVTRPTLPPLFAELFDIHLDDEA